VSAVGETQSREVESRSLDGALPLALVGVSKVYRAGGQEVTAVADLDLTVEGGEFMTLLGPSGSGKTTALQMVTGLQEPSEGVIRIGEQDITFTPVHKREIGVVFQNYALFPHLSVRDNVAFPLRLRRWSRTAVADAVRQALALVRLVGFEDRMPSQLSGGQQQRVAIARALVFQPRVLLMDEPLGALDKKLRDHMQLELRQLQQRIGITCMYVTHDQEEAMLMSDRIAILNHGRLQQVGTAEEIYARPANEFVGDFVGRINLWDGLVVDSTGRGCVVELAPGLRLRCTEQARAGSKVKVAIRPEAVRLVDRPSTADDANVLRLQVASVRFTGAFTLVQGTVGTGLEVLIQMEPGAPALGGTETWVSFAPQSILIFSREEERELDTTETGGSRPNMPGGSPCP
jgi:spermidine/putrescine ABC transporter ATP-binding subunit